MPYKHALQGGMGGLGALKPPQGSEYAMGCISTAIPSIRHPKFLFYINTKLQNNIHNHMSLHTMIQVSFTGHNATNYVSILSPYNFAIPFFITILLRHLEWFSTLIVDVCSFIGSLMDHSLHSRSHRLALEEACNHCNVSLLQRSR